MRRIETMHRNPLPDRGGRSPELGVAVPIALPDGTPAMVCFRKPISINKALTFASKVAKGAPYDGAAVTITR